jgi:phosphatidylinositol-3,4,5-trisphosphate 3-phosphatase/dual-specificity protein phosphatase PTEN
LFKANFLKRLVSQNKRRFENETFDLDLAYITKRVIAMGYPAYGCETMYRNNIVDVLNFMETQHKHNVKIYNLCIEPERIYEKTLFKGIPVGLFPSKDHNPCPVK